MKLPIGHVDIRFSAHSTEDPEKVKKAVYNLLPEDRLEEVTFKKTIVKGHYGNPIILFETRITDGELIKAVVDKLSTNLSDLDKETMRRESNLFLEKSNLHFRLDKQYAFKDKFKFHRADPINIRIHFRRRDKRSTVEICRELGLMS